MMGRIPHAQTFTRTWFDQQKSLMLAELTVSYETNLRQQQRERRKSIRSWSLV